MGLLTGHAAAKIDRIERSTKVLELARQRYTYEEIGAELGISHETARRDLYAAMERAQDASIEMAQRFRADIVPDLLEVCAKHFEKAKSGDIPATQAMDKMVHRIALLLGAYPANTASEGSEGNVVYHFDFGNTQINVHTNANAAASEHHADVIEGHATRNEHATAITPRTATTNTDADDSAEDSENE